MKRHLSWLFILLGAGFIVFALGFLLLRFGIGKSENTSAPLVGYIAPDFELQNLTGQSIRLGNLRGHPVLINFWATWCDYCLQEMPVIEKYYERYSPNLIVLGVEVGDSVDEVRSVVIKYGYTYIMLRDPDSHVFAKYRLDSFPVTFVLDEKGIIQVKHVGYMSEDYLVAYLNKVGFNK
jgi:peroxiredoxin